MEVIEMVCVYAYSSSPDFLRDLCDKDLINLIKTVSKKEKYPSEIHDDDCEIIIKRSNFLELREIDSVQEIILLNFEPFLKKIDKEMINEKISIFLKKHYIDDVMDYFSKKIWVIVNFVFYSDRYPLQRLSLWDNQNNKSILISKTQ